MPWVKGQSGNPNGRPKMATVLARLARSKTNDGLDLIDFAVRVMRGEEKVKEVRSATDAKGRRKTIEVAVPPTLEERMDAMKWLADRGWGKAVETIEITEPDKSGLQAPDEALEEGLGPEGSVQ